MCTLRELQDGTYSIDDVADMHEALDMRDEAMRLLKLQSDQKTGRK